MLGLSCCEFLKWSTVSEMTAPGVSSWSYRKGWVSTAEVGRSHPGTYVVCKGSIMLGTNHVHLKPTVPECLPQRASKAKNKISLCLTKGRMRGHTHFVDETLFQQQ
jgi:uncharacterized membrane protein